MTTNKIKVVEFFGEPLNYGGQETFIINVYSKIDKNKFSFTFITPFECTNQKLLRLIKRNGDTIVCGNKNFQSNLRKKHILDIAKQYLTKDYNVIHIHSGSTFTLCNVAKISKQKGIKNVVVHSHAAGNNKLKSSIIKLISKIKFKKYADHYLACSKSAGEWKYTTDIIKSSKYQTIKNGIDINNYKYNDRNKLEYRKKSKLESQHILINIGRFSKEKNQSYVLDIFDEIVKKDSLAVLLLVGGDGELLDEIKTKINKLGLTKKVHILTNRNDVNELINMSDVFILPSLREGLPFTGIEAQANGIPCIFSDTITDELNISQTYHKLPITVKPAVWAEKVIELFSIGRVETANKIRQNGYDIIDTCNVLEGIYERHY